MSLDIFDDARQKRKQLLAIFETLPTISVYGVVGANGPSGGKVPPAVHWSLNLNLIAWRIPGGPVRNTHLSVSKIVSDEELRALQNSIKSESIVAFQGKLCESSPFGDARAQLISLLDRPSDNELELILSQFRQPVEIIDSVVGRLVLNKSVNWFEGKVTWLGKHIEIAVSVDDDGNPADSLKTAKALLEAMEQWANKVNDYAADELLELKNDNWLGEDESPLSKAAFINRMQLNSITAYPHGDFDFWHHDGDLFWGHSIQVSGSLSEGLTCADIAG
ncbi:DUF2262 domain-containing protein [Chitinimonas sp. BJB300]|uniref:DUF2262 domain-containing protein n=1 Tax=Chitinimonas sp. BJB300 TaxID=1559339 RepID=UPI000C0FEFC9|nr:DUF2262 domain-containing protein [Chitinimonas sp. BJB300]PHV09947.1 hypothetical protein CSQ89_18830 [Chitinimonas sp. BJB300]TSJ82868.1 DUF2262 domain-containing protein [Chitinimonas sp. BJB300]